MCLIIFVHNITMYLVEIAIKSKITHFFYYKWVKITEV